MLQTISAVWICHDCSCLRKYAPPEECDNSGNLILITSWNIGIIVIFILQMKKSETKRRYLQSHTVNNWPSWGLNPGNLVSDLLLFSAVFIVPRIVFGTKKVLKEIFCKWITITGRNMWIGGSTWGHTQLSTEERAGGSQVVFWRSPFFKWRHDRWLRVSQMKMRRQRKGHI